MTIWILLRGDNAALPLTFEFRVDVRSTVAEFSFLKAPAHAVAPFCLRLPDCHRKKLRERLALPYSISSLLCRHLGQVSEPCRAQVAAEGTKRSSPSPTQALSTLGERFSDARPVSQRVFMSGHELDGELRVAPAAQRLDALLDLGLARRERGGAD